MLPIRASPQLSTGVALGRAVRVEPRERALDQRVRHAVARPLVVPALVAELLVERARAVLRLREERQVVGRRRDLVQAGEHAHASRPAACAAARASRPSPSRRTRRAGCRAAPRRRCGASRGTACRATRGRARRTRPRARARRCGRARGPCTCAGARGRSRGTRDRGRGAARAGRRSGRRRPRRRCARRRARSRSTCRCRATRRSRPRPARRTARAPRPTSAGSISSRLRRHGVSNSAVSSSGIADPSCVRSTCAGRRRPTRRVRAAEYRTASSTAMPATPSANVAGRGSSGIGASPEDRVAERGREARVRAEVEAVGDHAVVRRVQHARRQRLGRTGRQVGADRHGAGAVAVGDLAPSRRCLRSTRCRACPRRA